MKALIIHSDARVEVQNLAGNESTILRQLQAIVGGYIEGVAPNMPGALRWHAYCNEEGKIHGMPVNMLANLVATAAGWHVNDLLVGPVVFLGGEGPSEGDVPEELVTLAEGILQHRRDS